MVQRIAMKMITGCFKTTSTVALQYETELLPIELELRKQVTRYLTRIQTLPAKHPTKVCLQEAVRHWRTTNSKTFSSNLEHLVKQYPEYIAENMGRNTPIHQATMVDIKEYDNAHRQHPQRESERSTRKPH